MTLIQIEVQEAFNASSVPIPISQRDFNFCDEEGQSSAVYAESRDSTLTSSLPRLPVFYLRGYVSLNGDFNVTVRVQIASYHNVLNLHSTDNTDVIIPSIGSYTIDQYGAASFELKGLNDVSITQASMLVVYFSSAYDVTTLFSNAVLALSSNTTGIPTYWYTSYVSLDSASLRASFTGRYDNNNNPVYVAVYEIAAFKDSYLHGTNHGNDTTVFFALSGINSSLASSPYHLINMVATLSNSVNTAGTTTTTAITTTDTFTTPVTSDSPSSRPSTSHDTSGTPVSPEVTSSTRLPDWVIPTIAVIGALLVSAVVVIAVLVVHRRRGSEVILDGNYRSI